MVDSVEKTDFNNYEDQLSHANYYDDDFSTTFMSFSPDSNALIRWMEYDEALQLGMGYLHYQAGQTIFEAKEKQLSIMWEPITPKKDNLISKIMQVTYTVYLTESVQKAKAAANCGVQSEVNFFSKTEKFGSQKHKEFNDQGKWMQLVMEVNF